MSGKCRPSLRPKTLYNVDRSSLSTTDKECIRSVFELADHQKSEIEKNEKIIKAGNDLIETQKAEIERLKNLLSKEEEKYKLCAKRFYKEGVKEYVKKLKESLLMECRTVVEGNDMEGITDVGYQQEDADEIIDNLVKEMVGDDNV